ncbi:DUF4271 domain-containing protein [Ginsengibacter hankyongi]|nr:DUF4271 domain-containing protein [Ginsengibacter hankyongi]
MTRYFITTFLLTFFCAYLHAQQQSASLTQVRTDTLGIKLKDSPGVKTKSPKVVIHRVITPDTSAILLKDTTRLNADSIKATAHRIIKSYHSFVDSLLASGKFINVKDPPIFFGAEGKQITGKEFIFYSLCFVILILGIFKTFYNNYFNNLFRVFFNTSIRQTQLTDQLLQAKLPSFILNIFFAISVGFYVWLLFKHYHPPRLINNKLLLPFCIAGIGALYFIKYCILKFMGWMSGMQQAADNYIFVIFLVNKITGIILVPFSILLAFSMAAWTNYIVTFSLLMMGLFFLSRYIKTYGVLEYRFPLEPLHFVIYVTAVEILPLLIVYKLVVDYFI